MRGVKQEKHIKFCKEKEAQGFMVSAKTGESVLELNTFLFLINITALSLRICSRTVSASYLNQTFIFKI